MRRFVIILFLLHASVPSAHAQEWNVRDDDARRAELGRRYEELFLADPTNHLALRGLVGARGSGPGLDHVIRRVQKRIVAAPTSRDYLALGLLLRERGRAAESLDALERATELDDATGVTWSTLGLELVARGEADRAEVAFEKALDLATSPRDRRVLLRRLLDASLASGHPERALDWSRRLVEASPGDASLRIEYAEIASVAGLHLEAIDAYHEALRRSARNGKLRAQIFRDLSTVYLDANRPYEAIAALRDAIASTGRRAWLRRELWVRLADAHRTVGTVGAIYDELRSEWSAPSYADSLYLASLAEEAGRDEEAERMLRRACRLEPELLEPRERLIVFLQQRHATTEIERLYEEMAHRWPDRGDVRIAHARWVYFSLRDAGRAMDLLRDAQNAAAGDSAQLLAVATAWRSFGLPDQAISIVRGLWETDATDTAVVETYGAFLQQHGFEADGRAVWETLLELDDPVRARVRLGDLYARQRDWDRAIGHLERAVTLAEHGKPAIRQQLASVFEQAHRWGEAARIWEDLHRAGAPHAADRLVEVARKTRISGLRERIARRAESGTLEDALLHARILLAEEGRFGPGFPRLERIVHRAPETTTSPAERNAWRAAARLLADLHEERGEWRSAIRTHIRLGDAFGTERRRAYREVARLSWKFGDSGGDPDLIERAVSAAPDDPDLRIFAGHAAQERHDVDRAIENFRAAIELRPTDFNTYFFLARLLLRTDQREEATELMLRVVRRDASGSFAIAAALSALDYSETDDELRHLERAFRSARGNLGDDDFVAVMVAVYSQLFVYAHEPARAFADLALDAFPILIQAMLSDDFDDRGRASTILALYPGERVARAAAEQWNHVEEWTEEMLVVLARTRHPAAARVLGRAARSPDPQTRIAALTAMRWTPHPSQAPLLLEIAARGNHDERLAAIHALRDVPTNDASKFLRTAAFSAEAEVRHAAVWALGGASHRASDLLGRVLREASPPLAYFAAVQLAGQDTDAASRELLTTLWDVDEEARQVARRGLCTAIDTTLEDHDFLERRPSLATWRLEERLGLDQAFARRIAVVTAVARERLEDPDRRLLVLQDLVSIAPDDTSPDHPLPSIVAGIRPNLRNITMLAGPDARFSAAFLLPHAPDVADIPAVLGAVATASDQRAQRLVRQLDHYPPDDVRPAVLAAAHHPRAAARAGAVQVLARFTGDDEALATATHLVDDPDPKVRHAALAAVGPIGGDRALPLLVERYEDANFRTRHAILSSLRSIDSPHSRAALQKFELLDVPTPCDGDPNDLQALLRDECTNMLTEF